MSSFIQRVQEKTIYSPNGCWLWGGAQTGQRKYGAVWYNQAVMTVHRAIWIHLYGDLSSGIDVCHKCDVPLCCNPDHLFAGSRFDNMLDCVLKGRTRKGEDHYKAHRKSNQYRLTPRQVKSIRRRLREGEMAIRIAREYGIHRSTVREIKKGRSWSWLKA